MPVTKQALKRVKQANKRMARNRHYSSEMKSMIKLMLSYLQKQEADKAAKIFPKVMKSIDSAAKKNLIHKNNAARKKARLQKALSNLQSGKVAPKEEKKVTKKHALPVSPAPIVIEGGVDEKSKAEGKEKKEKSEAKS